MRLNVWRAEYHSRFNSSSAGNPYSVNYPNETEIVLTEGDSLADVHHAVKAQLDSQTMVVKYGRIEWIGVATLDVSENGKQKEAS